MATHDEQSGAQKKNYVAAMKPDPAKPRVEIDEFLDDNAMTNLFLLALADMQKEDPQKRQANGNEDWWTFYSLSGISIPLLANAFAKYVRYSWSTTRIVERCA